MAAPDVSTEVSLQSFHAALLAWAQDVGVAVPPALKSTLPPEPAPPRHTRILFGEHKGLPLWEQWSAVPGAPARDLLLQMVITQADCHLGAVEMGRNLVDGAPTREDEAALKNALEENFTHAAALGALLIRHFPRRGPPAAMQLLERRAYLQTRVLNAFNRPLRHWVDMLCFSAFVSLCARYALECLAVGAFAPVAATAEALARHHHVQSRMGQWGLSRIVEAGRIPPELLQKYINRWVALGLDLFGWERSETAAAAWRAGLKGRVHERERATEPDDPTLLNDDARMRWLFEVESMLAQLNTLHGGRPLRVPPMGTNRDITEEHPLPSAHGAATAARGSPDAAAWPLPGAEDDARIIGLATQPDWILPP